MSDVGGVRFPCDRVPDDAGTARLLGLYEQRGQGRLMQRIKVHAGRISPAQLCGVAALARTYMPDFPLHVTTRQDIELHGVKPEDVPAVQRGLHAAGLTTVGACGDSLRNVTVCPGSGVCEGTMDVVGVADRVRASLESLPCIRHLPRKLKISVSGCDRACAKPWINDVGLVARSDGTFTAILGGSLGARPNTGILVEASLHPAQVVPLAVGAARLFHETGDRKRRTRARLRHVRERIGDEPFRQAILARMREEAGSKSWPEVAPGRVEGEVLTQTRLHLPRGDIDPQDALTLSHVAEQRSAEVRIGLEHDVILYTPEPLALPDALRALADGPRIVACPGSAWCKKGLADSRATADGLREALPPRCGLSVCVNGCPNNCAHAAVADIGLVGRTTTVDGTRRPSYRLLVGGGRGRTPALGHELCADLDTEDAPLVVARLVRAWADANKTTPEPFAAFAARRGLPADDTGPTSPTD